MKRLGVRTLLVALVLALLATGCGGAKSYSFPQVRIEATVGPDGSLSIVEQRTFDFHGHFHFAFFTVEHKQFHDVRDFAVSENGTPFVPDGEEVAGHARLEDDVLEGPGGFKYKATWWFDANDERRTFTISYRVLCAVDAYQDTAHLLWKFIGEGWTEPTDHAVVTVHLPQPATAPTPAPAGECDVDDTAVPTTADLVPLAERPDVRAWGHGPLQGNVALSDPRTVVLDVNDVPPSTFVEGSVLFPLSMVPLEPVLPIDMKDQVLAEERTLAEQANELRREARAREHQKVVFRWVFFALLLGLIVLANVLVLIGRRRDRVMGVPRELDQPPEQLHPSKLAMEWAWLHRTVGIADAFRAQLLRLARLGAIAVVPLGSPTAATDYQLSLRAVPEDALDEKFADFLFVDDRPVSLRELKPNHEQRKDLREWRSMLEDYLANRSEGPHGRVETKTLGWLFLASLFAFIPLGVLGGLGMWSLLLPITSLALWLAARRRLPRRTFGEQRERMARWSAFQRYLTHFPSVTDAPAAAIVIWEQFLEYAVALGVASRVEKQVRAIVPVEDLPSPFPGGPSGLGGMLVFSSIQDRSVGTMAVAASAAPSVSSSGSSSSSFSSSSGFGGGFSSGGGGGGGGTGGGAG